MTSAERIARAFHDTYEKLAPAYGYETRETSRVRGREASTNAEGSLRAGWPKCCGYTMTLESTKEFIAAVETGSAMSWLGDDIKRAGEQIKRHNAGL